MKTTGNVMLLESYKILFRKGNILALVAPLVVYLMIFYAYPMLQMISRSFQDPNLTLIHYFDFFRMPACYYAMFNTFKIALFTTIFCFILGYPIAYLLTTVSQRSAQILTVLIIVPFWISILVRIYAWMVLLGRNGIVNQLLMKLSVIETPIAMMHNRFGVYVGMINILLPYMIFPLFSVMKGIDKTLVNAALIMGAPPWKAFLKVFFPLSLPGVAAGGLLVFIIALGFFITPALLGGAKDTTIALLIQIQVDELLNWGLAAAMATMLLICTSIVLVIYNRYLGIDKMVGS